MPLEMLHRPSTADDPLGGFLLILHKNFPFQHFVFFRILKATRYIFISKSIVIAMCSVIIAFLKGCDQIDNIETSTAIADFRVNFIIVISASKLLNHLIVVPQSSAFSLAKFAHIRSATPTMSEQSSHHYLKDVVCSMKHVRWDVLYIVEIGRFLFTVLFF